MIQVILDLTGVDTELWGMGCQRWSPVGESGGILCQNIFKTEVLGNGISTLNDFNAESASNNVSIFFSLKGFGVTPKNPPQD